MRDAGWVKKISARVCPLQADPGAPCESECAINIPGNTSQSMSTPLL